MGVLNNHLLNQLDVALDRINGVFLGLCVQALLHS